MRVSASLFAVVGTAAGAVAAVVAYQAGTGAATAPASSSQDKAAETRTVAPVAKPRTTFKPCEKGTKLRKGVCVRVKHKTVVVIDPAPALPVAGPVLNARTTSDRDRHDSTEDRGGREPTEREHAAVTGGEDRAHADQGDDENENENEHEDAVEDNPGDESDDAPQAQPGG